MGLAAARSAVSTRDFRSTILEWKSTTRPERHGVADEDIQHAVANAMVIEDQDDDTRLYLGAAIAGVLLEVVTIIRADGIELAIHAMPMRPKYRRLLPGE